MLRDALQRAVDKALDKAVDKATDQALDGSVPTGAADLGERLGGHLSGHLAGQGAYLRRFEVALEEALTRGTQGGPEGPEVLLEAARHLCLAGAAKRARPRLTHLFGRAVDAPEEALVDVAVAGELIHAGSLLHDDVVDGAASRRGRPTANALWGPTAAVLSGDLVLTLAFLQLTEHPRPITSEAVETIAAMTRGVMAEVLARGRVELPLDQWQAIVDGKTASLFAWCARSAARLGTLLEADGTPRRTAPGDPGWEEEIRPVVERFDRSAHHLGMAFQLADDLLDFQETGTGKDPYSDITNREPTYPILLAVERSPAVRREVTRLWAAPEITAAEARALGRAMVETGAGEATAERITLEVRSALAALGPWAERPGGREIAAWSRRLETRAHRALEAVMAGRAAAPATSEEAAERTTGGTHQP